MASKNARKGVTSLFNKLTSAGMHKAFEGLLEMNSAHGLEGVLDVCPSIIKDILSLDSLSSDCMIIHMATVTCFYASITSAAFTSNILGILKQPPQRDLDAAPTNIHFSQNGYRFISYLYQLGALEHHFLYAILFELLRPLSEESSKIVLCILQVSGATLRKCEPRLFKKLVELVEGIDASSLESFRSRFLVECIIDLKNNASRLKKDMRDLNDCRAKLDRFLDGIGATKKTCSVAAIADLGPQVALASTAAEKHSGPIKADSDACQLPALSNAQHMNTDIRKSLFLAIMSASETMQATQSILSLCSNFRSKWVREAATVLLHCCVHEKTYNPFYAYLSVQLARHLKSLRFYLRVAFLEFVDSVEDKGARTLLIGARYFGHLIRTEVLKCTVLEQAMKSALCSKRSGVFCRILVTSFLDQSSFSAQHWLEKAAFGRETNSALCRLVKREIVGKPVFSFVRRPDQVLLNASNFVDCLGAIK